MRINPRRLLHSALFTLATLAATGLLVAAGLNEAAATVATAQAAPASPAP